MVVRAESGRGADDVYLLLFAWETWSVLEKGGKEILLQSAVWWCLRYKLRYRTSAPSSKLLT